MDALMPLACNPVQIAGRNRVWRKMIIDGISQDPDWKNGDYNPEPRAGLQIASYALLIAGSAPLVMQKDFPTRDAADKYLDDYTKREMSGLDANNLLYAVSSSRNYVCANEEELPNTSRGRKMKASLCMEDERY